MENENKKTVELTKAERDELLKVVLCDSAKDSGEQYIHNTELVAEEYGVWGMDL